MYGRIIKKILNLPADLWKIHFFSRVELSNTFREMFSHFQSSHARDHLPPPTNKKQPKPTQQHPAQHHTAHTNPMAITTTSTRGVNPPQRTAANDDQEHATSTQHPKESKRKADADDENVETLHQKGASVDDNKNTKSPPNRLKRKKSNDKAKTANDTEALHAASEDKSENQQPTKSKGKDNSRQTSKSNESGALESSSNHNQSSTQGLTTPVKGTTVSKHGFSTLEKPVFFSPLKLIMY
jgi:hypothetical protein